MRLKCGVVIVAGGSGTRAGGEVPKQFQPLLGIPLFLWSVHFFAAREAVSGMVVVAHQAFLTETERLLSEHGLSGRVSVVLGGARRQDSVLAGVEAAGEECAVVAVHDAARPFPPANFEAAVDAADRVGGAIFAAPVTDSIKKGEGGRIAASVPRDGLWAAQTPQLARRELLLRALRECVKDGVEVTDEAAALERIGCPVALVEAPRSNLKVTLPEDWLVAEAIARSSGRIPLT